MYKLKIQSNKCNACGMCALECSVLQEDSSGKVEVIGEGIIPDSEIGKVRNIVELCPEGALSLTEEFVDMSAKLAELKSKMKQPLKFTPPPYDDYAFRLEDKDEYAQALWNNSRGGVSDEYEFDYKSASAARSAGERAFHDEIYSQAEALAQQVIVMYEQRKMNRVARYAETEDNYKYSVHQQLIKDLRSFVNELESYTGRKISLPSDFFTFRTRDTEYINRRQEKSNDWLANRIKENLESPSEFYSCVKTDKTSEYVTVSSWFGSDKEKLVYKYAYYIDADGLKRFYNHVVRTTWKSGKYTKQDAERELDAFHKAIEQEWLGKIAYLSNQIGDEIVQKNSAIERRETPPKKKPIQKSLPLHELKRILLNSYPTGFCMPHKDKDYGDLWHISHNGYDFVDERFERNRTSVDRNWRQINERDKAFALPLICHGRYTESDCIRIGVIRKEKSSIGNQTEADRFLGFALTKDSFCMKGLWLADCIIPYGNIKEVKDTAAFNNKEIVFLVSEGETGHIVLSSGQYGFDGATREQLEKYLNTVKNYYSPEYDKLFLKSTSTWSLFGDPKTPWF